MGHINSNRETSAPRLMFRIMRMISELLVQRLEVSANRIGRSPYNRKLCLGQNTSRTIGEGDVTPHAPEHNCD